nr:MAG TPA: hypothetical protein [Inoviridae sp.]
MRKFGKLSMKIQFGTYFLLIFNYFGGIAYGKNIIQ